MAVELRVIDATNVPGEILPDWSDLTFTQQLIGPGALAFSYPTDGRNASLLTHGQQLAVKVDGYEPLNGRFTYTEGTGSRIAESDNGVCTYGCTSNIARLAQMMIAPAFTSTSADSAMVALNPSNKTPGAILLDSLNNAMARAAQKGSVPWLTYPVPSYGSGGFDAVRDASGTPWGQTYDLVYSPAVTLDFVVDNMVENGLLEVALNGTVLQAYLPANHGRDLTDTAQTNAVILQTGHDFTEATYETKSTDLVNALLVIGESTGDAAPPCIWLFDNASIAANGYREGTLNVSNATSTNLKLLTAAGNAYLSLHSTPRWAYTYAVASLYLDTSYALARGSSRPFIDYQVGDTILVLDGVQATPQRLQVLTATYPNAQSSSVALTVNDFLQDRDVQYDRFMARVSNGLPGN